MSKMLYVKETESSAITGKAPSGTPLLYQGVVVQSNQYDTGWYTIDSQGNLHSYYFQYSIQGATFQKPDDLYSSTYTIVGPDGSNKFTLPSWKAITVDDAFTIPFQDDLTGLSANVHYGNSTKTEASYGPFGYDPSGSDKTAWQKVGDALKGAFTTMLGNAGLGGLAQGVRNSDLAGQAMTSILSGGTDTLQKAIGVFDKGGDARQVEQLFNDYVTGIRQTTNKTIAGQSFSSDPATNAALHDAIAAFGLTTDGVTAGGSYTIKVSGEVGGFAIETSNTSVFSVTIGGDGGQTIRGQSGTNYVLGGAGNDTIYAGGGSDVINAGAGDDTMRVGTGSAFFDGGAGFDTLSFSGNAEAVSVYMDGVGALHLTAKSQDTTAVNVEALGFDNGTFRTDAAALVVDDYLTLMGRAPTASELGVWSNALAGGTSAASMEGTIARAAGGTTVTEFVAASYRNLLGRAPIAAESGYWTGALAAGQATPTSLDQALTAAATSAGTFGAFVTASYQAYLGRAPSAAEVKVWGDALLAGTTDERQMLAVLAAQPGAGTATVQSLYQGFFGRAATDAELGYWAHRIAGGEVTARQLQTILVNDPSGSSYLATQVTSLYQTYFGRAPTAAEQGVWHGLVAGGTALTDLRVALTHDAAGVAHINDAVNGAYLRIFGRAATAAETAVWLGAVQAGTGLDQMSAALVADPGSLAHRADAITAHYQTYFGRAPTAGELAVWQRSIATATDTAGLRYALTHDAAGVAHIQAVIAADYQELAGRTATAADQLQWLQTIQAGTTLDTARGTIAHTTEAVANLTDEVKNDYGLYLGRTPTSTEAAYWLATIQQGASEADLLKALDMAAGTGVVQNFTSIYRAILSPGASEKFTSTLLKGERYNFQVTSYDVQHPLKGVVLTLTDSQGHVVATSAGTGSQTSVTLGFTSDNDPAFGTYTLAVSSSDPAATGRFSIQRTDVTSGPGLMANIVSDPGSSIATAYDLGHMGAGSSLGWTEHVTSGDKDFYAFHLDQTSQVDIRASASIGTYSLFDANGTEQLFSSNTYTAGAHSLATLSAGEYYLEFYSNPGVTLDYSFHLFT